MMALKGLAIPAAVKALQIPAVCLSCQLFRGVLVRPALGIAKFLQLHQLGNQRC
jgi:hypothetical protein